MTAQATLSSRVGHDRSWSTLVAGLPTTLATRIVLGLVVASLFLEKNELVGYNNGSLPLPDFFFIAAIAVLAAKLLMDTGARISQPQPLTTLDGALVLFVCLLGVVSVYPAIALGFTGQTFKTFVHLLFLLCGSLLIGRSLNREMLHYVLMAYFVGAVIVSAVGILQAVDQNFVSFGLTDTLGLRYRDSGSFVRPISVFSEPAYLGYAGLAGILVGIWRLHAGRAKSVILGMGICSVSLLLAGAMGPVVIGVAIFAVLSLARRSIKINPLALIGAGLVVLVLIFSPAGRVLLDRADSILYGRDPSLDARSSLNQGSISIWKLAPITGVGLGNSRFYLYQFVRIPGIDERSNFPAANAYLALLGETGPIGVLGLTLVLLLMLRGQGPLSSLSSDENLVRTLVLMTALQFFIIGTFLLPPFWFWSGLRIGQLHNSDGAVEAVENGS